MYLKKGRSALLALAATLLAPSALALTAYTAASQWEIAVGGLAVELETFDQAPAGSLSPNTTVIQPKGILSIWLDSNDQEAVRILKAGDSGLVFQGRVCDSSLPATGCGPKQLYVDFKTTAPVVAFAADWSGTSEQDVLTIQVGTSVIRLDQIPGFTGDGFLGFVDSTPFSRVTFGLADAKTEAVLEGFTMDNVRIAEVPLPASLLFLASALASLHLARGRRRQ
ncbi:MAG: VPLPA-CTERM sorting domain-containing protein [Gammaproteobacteria bacterium]|nr:VPLPA-CTERM sorting domain-containing protein [Gammaproteobacteria bacterium]